MQPSRHVQIGKNRIGSGEPIYFIADIAANHDGDLQRAKDLIWLAAESGAHAAKFQHFSAATIVSDYGFRSLGQQQSHQQTWSKSVFEVYQDASVNIEWNQTLADNCKKAGIDFFTSPYSHELIECIDSLVSAYKIGSGDISWLDIVRHIARKNKPVLIATGASSLVDVQQAVSTIIKINPQIVLMQCNTNYTGAPENFKYINLNVLKTYRELYPDIILGLSDHSPGHTTVLGAIALGACVVEKHLTDDNDRVGPDHKFSMNGKSWREMVNRTHELELALGDGIKRVEENEEKTVIIQRRAMRATRSIKVGETIRPTDFTPLRPCPRDALPLGEFMSVQGYRLKRNIERGDYLTMDDVRG